jgi:tRNA threonylcarbamoyladenosine biosynthesis protein TsaB
MSVVLAIDTAAPRLGLALLQGERVDRHDEPMATGQAERLFPALEALLAGAGITLADLTRIAVTTGPGSFTGLRIGLSAARGLGLALGRPVLGIPSLLALSLATEGPSAVLLDARRGEAYLQLFSAPGQPTTEARLLPLDDAEALLPPDVPRLTSPFVDLARLARFAATAEPGAWPPEASYIRGADAKPQDRFRIARIPA